MDHTHSTTQRSWLLVARGILYILIGGSMFMFASSYSAQSGHIIGSLAMLAGICQLVSSFVRNQTDKNNFWGILHGITDVGFGIAILLFSNGTVKSFVDVLGFWAMMYAFLQAVQAMYAFMAARGNGTFSGTSLVHLTNVLVSGGLTFTLLLRPAGFDNSLNFIGIFPMLLGVLIIVLARQMRENTTRSY